jgi:hypothetical protein
MLFDVSDFTKFISYAEKNYPPFTHMTKILLDAVYKSSRFTDDAYWYMDDIEYTHFVLRWA